MLNYQGVYKFPIYRLLCSYEVFKAPIASVLTQAKGTPLHLSKGCDEAHEVTPRWHIQIPFCVTWNGTNRDSTHGGLTWINP